MRAFTYVVVHDSGFAPNPFHGWCTLACCKPRIREAARPGDLVMGLSAHCERLVYVMRVAERLTFEEYWSDPRFSSKRATWRSRQRAEKFGDNIYSPDGEGGFAQQPSAHWDHRRRREDAKLMARDLGSRYVLVASDFAYFGADGPPLPFDLAFAKVTRGHRSRFNRAQIEALERYFNGAPRGLVGRPSGWPREEPVLRGVTLEVPGRGAPDASCSA